MYQLSEMCSNFQFPISKCRNQKRLFSYNNNYLKSYNRQQQVGMMYYEEFIERISRPEVIEIETVVKEIVHEINPGLFVVTCGSYRRGKGTCGDVDCLISHPDGKSHKGVFQQVEYIYMSHRSLSYRESAYLITPFKRYGHFLKFVYFSLLVNNKYTHTLLTISYSKSAFLIAPYPNLNLY